MLLGKQVWEEGLGPCGLLSFGDTADWEEMFFLVFLLYKISEGLVFF